MKNGRLQAKDIPDGDVLRYLASKQGQWNSIWEIRDAIGDAPNVAYPERVLLAKLDSLVKRGLVDGCTCGCRGDFEITKEGLAYLCNLNV